MSTLVILEATVKSGALPALNTLMRNILPDTRAYDGCQNIEIYNDEESSKTVFIQHWDSRAQYEKYLVWRQETGLVAELGALFDSPPDIRFYERVET